MASANDKFRPRFAPSLGLVTALRIGGAERAAEFHGIEAEAIAQIIRGARQLFELGAALDGEQVELLRAMRQTAQAYTKQADFAAMVAVLAEKLLEYGENIGVELRWLAKCFGARVRVKAGVTNGESERARGEACFAQTLARLLRKMAQHRGERNCVIRVFAERVIVRNGFRFGVDHEFVGIAAARLAV